MAAASPHAGPTPPGRARDALGLAVFLALWWAAFAVGRKIDREKAEYAEQG